MARVLERTAQALNDERVEEGEAEREPKRRRAPAVELQPSSEPHGQRDHRTEAGDSDDACLGCNAEEHVVSVGEVLDEAVGPRIGHRNGVDADPVPSQRVAKELARRMGPGEEACGRSENQVGAGHRDEEWRGRIDDGSDRERDRVNLQP